MEDKPFSEDINFSIFASSPPHPTKPLTINFFGGLQVFENSRFINRAELKRNKIQALIALLALNRGKEVSCEQVQKTLWYYSSPEKARNNFYTSWSLLRKAFTPAGQSECPYFLKNSQTCRMNIDLVHCDIFELEEISRELAFGSGKIPNAGSLYKKLSIFFDGEFLPGKDDYPFIRRYRKESQEILTDSLVIAARRSLTTFEYASTLSFARAALRYDKTREDAYQLLFQAQAKTGHRSGAIETYHTCLSVLSSELGILPSQSLMHLYNDMIAEDFEGFADTNTNENL